MSILGITCMRDEGLYMAEWIAHHLAAGFDHMLVLTHDCSDGADAVMEALAQDPRVTHLPFQVSGKKSVQWQALKIIKDHPLLAAHDWALFFDCDEFLCLPEGDLPGLIADMEASAGRFDALTLPWRLYGSGGVVTHEEGLTPERFTRAAPELLHFPLANLFKTLFRPEAFRQPGVHRPRNKAAKPARWLGADGAELHPGFAANDGAITLYGQPCGPRRVWLNHYSLRSRQEFLVKRARGLPNHMEREIGLTYWAERNWNVVEAVEILPMLDATRAELAGLRELPGIGDAEAACRVWHQNKFRDLIGDIDMLRLDFRLGMLTGSTPPSAEEGRTFLQAQMALLRAAKT